MRIFEFARTGGKGIYVCAEFSDQTNARLRQFQESNDIPNPLPDTDFHSTIVYSRRPIKWTIEDDIKATAKPVGFHVWPSSDKKCLVMEIKSDYLQERFDLAMEQGASYDFPEYISHITLSYDVGNFDASKLEVPDFDIEIIKEHKELLDDETASL